MINPDHSGVLFASERELAAYAREQLEARGWEVWPEANGWDLYAQAGLDVTTNGAYPGDHLGIECKLRASWELLHQCLADLPWRRGWNRPPKAKNGAPIEGIFTVRQPARGPHWRAAVCPEFSEKSSEIFWGLGVSAQSALTARLSRGEKEFGVKRERSNLFLFFPSALRFSPRILPELPELKVETPAGVPAPKTYSARKVAMVRAMLAVRRTPLTAREIAGFGANAYELARFDFLTSAPAADLFGAPVPSPGRRGRLYGPGRREADAPDRAYPEIVAALEAKGLA